MRLFFAIWLVSLQAGVNFEASTDAFVLRSKKIEIPGFPKAFNPSVIRWQGKLLMSFRNISNPKDSYNSSELGLVWLNDDFEVISVPYILQISMLPRRAEDGRLIEVGGRLFMIYSDNEDAVITKGGFRVYIAELLEVNGRIEVISKQKLTEYEGADPMLREKNWTPFVYENQLFLSYSLNPHRVFKPIDKSFQAETFALTNQDIPFWKWGELRGGTQTLEIDHKYLTFFHTAFKIASEHSDNKEMLHYFMGAAVFDISPPFSMTYISKEPIIGSGFFTGEVHKQYWGSWRGIFPGGFVYNDDFIYVVYGRQNCEVWVVTLDKKGLFNSLIPINGACCEFN